MPLPPDTHLVHRDKNMLLYLDSGGGAVAVGCATDASLEVNAEEIEVSCMAASAWKETVPGMKSWSVSFNSIYLKGTGVVLSADQLSQMLFDATLLTVKLSTEISGEKYYEGTVFVTKNSISVSAKDKATYSVSLTGTGALELKTVI